ncbi:uncharacterized protein B0I36DRAFT_347989 [Microdochium trichocladiopsis]|uniref:Uncharacterized protein n=1 Tax=Microdochium trichocladiopsis TaxID=1682393 RepID=A0A9P9BRH9_9PEZI|nr:uncharacterized protein B0I36DRAFT_347989 [Microdochium trichocladiopsis]KAH7032830.1 hypothetical protein B0I36DRAFT_347989 [Microdochium trichocladiopsis]
MADLNWFQRLGRARTPAPPPSPTVVSDQATAATQETATGGAAAPRALPAPTLTLGQKWAIASASTPNLTVRPAAAAPSSVSTAANGPQHRPALQARKKSSFMSLLGGGSGSGGGNTGNISNNTSNHRCNNLSSDPADYEEDEQPVIFVRTRGEDICQPPKVDDVARTVQAVLLQRGVMEALPIEYNAHMLHVLSEFFKMQARMQKKEARWEDMSLNHAWERQEWGLLGDEWLEREKEYKAEVKRLELLLSKISTQGCRDSQPADSKAGSHTRSGSNGEKLKAVPVSGQSKSGLSTETHTPFGNGEGGKALRTSTGGIFIFSDRTFTYQYRFGGC